LCCNDADSIAAWNIYNRHRCLVRYVKFQCEPDEKYSLLGMADDLMLVTWV